MTEARVRLDTTDDEHSGRPELAIRWLSSRERSTIQLAQGGPLGQLGVHTEAAEDLLAVALATYCADRVVARDTCADGWTRYIHLDVPVRRPDRWDRDLLERTISFLTGDHWRVTLRRGQPHPGLRTTDRSLMIPDTASLFSGGLDSLAGVCTSRQAGEMVALASYYDDGPSGHRQKQLVARLGSDHPHCRFRVEWTDTASNAQGLQPQEPTTRSRSFLFLALGLLVACAQGATRLRMAENGYVALNVPLHTGRIGSLSTRSAHPQFVDGLNQVIRDAEMGIKIENPYLFKTKGEVIECIMQHVPHIAWDTISCAHPTAGRWRGQSFSNCGYCYPCIVRQAGFHRNGDDETVYSIDPFTELSFYNGSSRSSDIRSVARFMLDPVQLGDILATGRVSSFTVAQELYAMYQRGVEELGDLFEARTSSAVKEKLGL